jgi:hypothetical protein
MRIWARQLDHSTRAALRAPGVGCPSTSPACTAGSPRKTRLHSLAPTLLAWLPAQSEAAIARLPHLA